MDEKIVTIKTPLMAAAARPSPKKRRTGRPRSWEPTNKQRHFIAVAAAAGLNHNEIAGAVGITRHVLERRCGKELEDGPATMNGRVAHKLFQKCMKGDTVSLLFWSKTRLGWRETNRTEHTGADGGPIVYEQIEAEAAAFTQRISQMAERFLPPEPANDAEVSTGNAETETGTG